MRAVGGWLRLGLVLLAVSAGVVTAAAPAAALPGVRGGVVCWLETRNGLVVKERCLDLTDPKVLPACRVCPTVAFDAGLDVLPIDRRIRVIDRLADGFTRLALADVARDPRQVPSLRRAALESFLAAAAEFRGVPVAGGTVGVFDRDRSRFVRMDIDWLASAEVHTVAGLVGASDPDGDPVDQLLGPFDTAFVEMRDGVPDGR